MKSICRDKPALKTSEFSHIEIFCKEPEFIPDRCISQGNPAGKKVVCSIIFIEIGCVSPDFNNHFTNIYLLPDLSSGDNSTNILPPSTLTACVTRGRGGLTFFASTSLIPVRSVQRITWPSVRSNLEWCSGQVITEPCSVPCERSPLRWGQRLSAQKYRSPDRASTMSQPPILTLLRLPRCISFTVATSTRVVIISPARPRSFSRVYSHYGYLSFLPPEYRLFFSGTPF